MIGADTTVAYAVGKPERFGLFSTSAFPSTLALNAMTYVCPDCSGGSVIEVFPVVKVPAGK